MAGNEKVRTTTNVAVTVEPVSLDVKHAAQFLDTSVRQVRTLIYSRELVPIVLGKKQLLLVSDLRAFIAKRRTAA